MSTLMKERERTTIALEDLQSDGWIRLSSDQITKLRRLEQETGKSVSDQVQSILTEALDGRSGLSTRNFHGT